MTFEYYPKGTCSTKINLDIENNIIKDIAIENGCNGNLKGIRNLLIGMDIDTVIDKFKGIDCHNKGTSCPDQIAKALEAYKKQ